MIRVYKFNPHGNNGVTHPKNIQYEVRLVCDKCNSTSPIVANYLPTGNTNIQEDFDIKDWEVKNKGLGTELHICNNCRKEG